MAAIQDWHDCAVVGANNGQLRSVAFGMPCALGSTENRSRPTIGTALPAGSEPVRHVMRNVLASMIAAGLTAAALIVATSAAPAQAHEHWPAIPAKIGVAPVIGGAGWAPYRCAVGPVYNFYHDAYYGGEPPALYLGYAYRPYYRYTAYRVAPRTYFCDRPYR